MCKCLVNVQMLDKCANVQMCECANCCLCLLCFLVVNSSTKKRTARSVLTYQIRNSACVRLQVSSHIQHRGTSYN